MIKMNGSRIFFIIGLLFCLSVGSEAARNRTRRNITYANEGNCPTMYTFYRGHCYMVSNETTNWFMAKSSCEKNSGMLFIIKNESDYEIFARELNKTDYKTIWVGFSFLLQIVNFFN